VIREDFEHLDARQAQYDPSYQPLYPPAEPLPPAPVVGAVFKYWYLVLLPVLVLSGAAVAIGLKRHPVYTAEARLNVGGFNISAESLPGFVGGAYLLANAYSRAAYGHAVLGPVAKKLHKSEDQLASAISSSPVKDSPIIRVDAESKNKAEAVTIANLVSTHLQDHARTLARSNPDSKRLLNDYKAAEADYEKAALRAVRAHRKHRNERSADTALEIARLQRNSTASLYQTSLGGQATTNAVQLLTAARGASSDRQAFLERVLAGGILGGLALGTALAYWRGRSRLPRRLVP